MGLFGSLFTGVSALFAQSQNTAVISNNIANINTTGFKRSESAFNSLVTSESRLSRYSPGTVSVNRIQRVSQQGPLQQSGSATDASISGNGFFPVKRDADDLQEFLYTRAGQFAEDSQGLLTNASGFVLYAWPIDSSGTLPANQGDLTSLVPANVAFLGGLTRPTTLAEMAINLDASQEAYNAGALDVGGPNQFGTTGFTGYPIPTSSPAHFSRGLTVFDQLGEGHTVTLEFRKVDGPQATARSEATSVLTRDTDLTDLAGIAAGNTFTVAATGTAAQTYIVAAAAGVGQVRVDTVGDLLDQLDDVYGGGTEIEAGLTPDGQVILRAKTFGDSITLTDTAGTALFGANGLNFPQVAAGVTETYDSYTLDGTVAQSTTNPYGTTAFTDNQGDFPTLEDSLNPNPAGWWELKIIHPDSSIITQGLLNYSGDGTLNATADSNGSIDVELGNIDWGNGSDPQSFNIDIERFSQFSGNYDVIFSDQNGAELGLRTGVEITRDGIIVARFSNGASADLYQIPLITFANANGLTEVSGTAYKESEESGEENLREAGAGGAGFVEPSTLEASNVDLADEFAKLIISQRAFGAGTRLINTVDQMTEDLLRLR
ncbi:MAG: flagellar hook-basal body complex protein [Alphaproteobacteria bacterium]|nr:flagellar hook-basal body complex protein [Alphaproteobacteria bacterium]